MFRLLDPLNYSAGDDGVPGAFGMRRMSLLRSPELVAAAETSADVVGAASVLFAVSVFAA